MLVAVFIYLSVDSRSTVAVSVPFDEFVFIHLLVIYSY